MNKIIAVLAVFFVIFSAISQDFKPVKTAQDVVDNYIEASGGKDALASIESISMKGNMGDGEQKGTIVIYFSKKYVYMDINTAQFSMQQAIDVAKKKGWMKFGTMIKDLKEEEIEKNSKNVEGSMWGNFIDPKKNGITFEMLQNETIEGKECYVIDLIRDSLATSTAYFDMKTFNKVREIKGGMTNDFSDFREVGSTGVTMPYSIKSQTGDVAMTEIKFNSKFDKKLLTRPKDDSEDTKKDEDSK